MALRSIRKQNISDDIYDQFMNAIVSGEWQRGEKIPSENDLALELGVSRVSVRNSLQRLAALGLIESRQGEGTYVRDYSSAQYMNNLMPMIILGKPDQDYIMEFRLLFESQMSGLAAKRASSEAIDKLEKIFLRHMELKDDCEAAAECDFEFHYLIAEATNNPYFKQIYNLLKDVFRYSLRDIVASMGTTNAEFYHRHIIDAIKHHDVEQAVSWMHEHVKDTIDYIRAHADDIRES